MKTTKAIAVISLCMLCLSWFGGQLLRADVQTKQDILHPQGLLWKIERPSQSPSYLFATMHVNHPRVVNLPPPVEQAFRDSRQFVMEMLLTFQAVGLVSRASFFSDGRTLDNVMQEENYRRLLAVLQQRLQIGESAIRHMKPWAVFSLLMMPVEQGSAAALDMQLYRRAIQAQKSVAGLETAQEQVDVFDQMSIADQLWLLNQAVSEIEQTDALFPEMLEAYVQGDLAALVQIQQQMMSAESDIDDRLMHRLLTARNQRMAQRMLPYLQQGNAFIAIGALHLPGQDGVLQLLQQQGYSVAPVDIRR
ncbi:MAG TPA: TraB/GumN family protein [Gammaproteobacteria bacterium]